MNTHRKATWRRRVLAIPAAGAALALVNAGAAQAAGPLPGYSYWLPAACGTHAGALVWSLSPITVDDHSADTRPLGTLASYYQVPAATGITVTIGTIYNDAIMGNSDVDIVCGGEGDDFVMGWEGDDTLYGNDGIDNLSGGLGADHLFGDAKNDGLFGDGVGSIATNDGADYIEGGAGADIMTGGSGVDVIDGGMNKLDYGDGGIDGALCTSVETGPFLNPGAGTC